MQFWWWAEREEGWKNGTVKKRLLYLLKSPSEAFGAV